MWDKRIQAKARQGNQAKKAKAKAKGKNSWVPTVWFKKSVS